VLSFDRLAPLDVDSLLDIKSQHFLPTLSSVIHVSSSDDGSLRAFHASFHDFMVDPKRCVDTPLNRINESLYHLRIAKICLRKLNKLKRDLLDLGKCYGQSLTGVTNENILDQIALIPKDLCYAVKYWSMHVACVRSVLDEELLLLLESFINSHIIHWVEALSYLGYLSEGVSRLEDVRTALDVSGASSIPGMILRPYSLGSLPQ
jgi:hypothetical protein